MKRSTPSIKWLYSFLLLFLLAGCHRLIAPFDQYAYTQTTSLKVDVLNLMDKSTEPYAKHEKEAEEVVSKLMKIIEYEKHRPNDGITVKMWNKMIDETKQKGIIGSYLQSWKKNGTKSEVMVTEYKPQISEGFDKIAELEAKKIKASDPGVQNFLKTNN